MWCDDFDLDLPKVIPGALEALGPAANILLYTHGHMTDGALNHPSVWNSAIGMLAFFGFDGAHKPKGYVTNEPDVLCTFEQAVRDAWVHGYHILLYQPPVVEGRIVWHMDGDYMQGVFNELMYHHRGLKLLSENDRRARELLVLVSLQEAAERTTRALGQWKESRAAAGATGTTGDPNEPHSATSPGH